MCVDEHFYLINLAFVDFVRTSFYPTTYYKVSTIERAVSWLA